MNVIPGDMSTSGLQGKILISQPTANSSFFSNTVVLVCEHHAKGAWGLAMTKPSANMTVDQLGADMGIPVNTGQPLHIGGPVQDDGLHFVHTPDVIVSNTLQITPDIYVTSSEAMLREIQAGRGPLHWRLFVGVCVWQAGQLEGEMSGQPPWTPQHRWLTQPCPRKIWNIPAKKLWSNQTDSAIQTSVKNFLE